MQINSNTLKCTTSALIYIGIHYQYNEVYYKYIQMHWKKIQIFWCLFKIHIFIIKNTLLYFNIHMCTFQKPYILFTYITISIPYSNILLYTSIYVETVMRPLYYAPFCLVTNTIFQNYHGTSLFYQDIDGMPWHLCWNSKIKDIPQIPYILLVN